MNEKNPHLLLPRGVQYNTHCVNDIQNEKRRQVKYSFFLKGQRKIFRFFAPTLGIVFS